MENLKEIQFMFTEGEMLEEEAEFMCYADSTMTYHLIQGECTYEIDIINEDREYFPIETIESLILTKQDSIKFLSWRAFATNRDELLSEGVMYIKNKSTEGVE